MTILKMVEPDDISVGDVCCRHLRGIGDKWIYMGSRFNEYGDLEWLWLDVNEDDVTETVADEDWGTWYLYQKNPCPTNLETIMRPA